MWRLKLVKTAGVPCSSPALFHSACSPLSCLADGLVSLSSYKLLSWVSEFCFLDTFLWRKVIYFSFFFIPFSTLETRKQIEQKGLNSSWSRQNFLHILSNLQHKNHQHLHWKSNWDGHGSRKMKNRVWFQLGSMFYFYFWLLTRTNKHVRLLNIIYFT